MRLHDFLSFFDESTMVKIIDNDEVLTILLDGIADGGIYQAIK